MTREKMRPNLEEDRSSLSPPQSFGFNKFSSLVVVFPAAVVEGADMKSGSPTPRPAPSFQEKTRCSPTVHHFPGLLFSTTQSSTISLSRPQQVIFFPTKRGLEKALSSNSPIGLSLFLAEPRMLIMHIFFHAPTAFRPLITSSKIITI
ncbi:hypothetical protein Droror1_Dr00028078 [Drosera rotundifolia]